MNIQLQHVVLQHINVKLLLKDPQGLDLDPVIPIFHGWIQEQGGNELLLDVADYRHVHGGPGVLLMGHEADYSVDNTDNRLGVRYNRKAVLDGGNQNRLAQAACAAISACQRLQQDTRLDGKLYFNGHDVEIFVNDRLLVPNSEITREALSTEFHAFSERLFGGNEYSLSFGNDPRRRLAVSLKASRAITVEDLLRNLRAALGAGEPAKLPSSSAQLDVDLVNAAWGDCVG